MQSQDKNPATYQQCVYNLPAQKINKIGKGNTWAGKREKEHRQSMFAECLKSV